MLISLVLPILLSGIALFFLGFLSWMVLQLHKKDWAEVKDPQALLHDLRKHDLQSGNYMFPSTSPPDENADDDLSADLKRGPFGVMTLFPSPAMGALLGKTFAYDLVISFCIGYLATLGIEPGADFMTVFRFVSTAAFLTLFAAIVPHSIWFRNRVTSLMKKHDSRREPRKRRIG